MLHVSGVDGQIHGKGTNLVPSPHCQHFFACWKNNMFFFLTCMAVETGSEAKKSLSILPDDLPYCLQPRILTASSVTVNTTT